MTSTRRLEMYAYTLQSNGPTIPLADRIEELDFTTVAPGGWGDLTCKLKVDNARLIPPELGLMANVAVMDGPFAVFQGRWDEPGIALSSTDGELLELHAMGGQDCLKDDPADSSYANKTAQYIIGQELSTRSAYLPLDQDTTQILPDAPTPTFYPAFSGKDLAQKINELSPLLGDYQWCVWNHAVNRDAAGFPTWQLYWHKRDTSTVSYTAYFDDMDPDAYTIRPAVEYSYNAVQLKYRDATTDAASSVTVTDSRLNANGSQGRAPFPRRKLVKDLSGYHLSSTQAAALANALLAQYQNGGWKITVKVNSIRDANGNPIPLWQVRADGNVFIPQMAPIAAQLPTSVLASTSGGNLYYIAETHYNESSGSTPTLELTCDSFYDTASFQIARLQYLAEGKMVDSKTHHVVRAVGEVENGECGIGWGANGLANDTWTETVNFKTTMTNTPSSISLTSISQANTRSIGFSSITTAGFAFSVIENANGSGGCSASYSTVGN